MRFILILFLCLATGMLCRAQYTYTITADSVKLTSSCDSTELIIQNHTQAVPGFLYNTGNGRTAFQRALQRINDSIYLIGIDTLLLKGPLWGSIKGNYNNQTDLRSALDSTRNRYSAPTFFPYDSTLYRSNLFIANKSPFINDYGQSDSAVHLVFIGDSRLAVFPLSLHNLVAQYNRFNGLGFVPFYYNIYPIELTYTTSGSFSATKGDNTSSENWGISGTRVDASTGAVFNFTPASKFTQFRIWYNQTSSSGTFSYSIDGGSPVSVNASGTGGDLLKNILISSGVSGNVIHTLSINVTSGPVRFYGVDFSNPSQSGYIVDILQCSGSQAAQWNGNMGYTAQYIGAVNPALCYIWLGINDAVARSPAATFGTNIKGVISGLGSIPKASVVLSTEMPVGLSWGGPEDTVTNDTTLKYNQQIYALGKTPGYGVFDLRSAWGNYYYFLKDSSYTDAIHPTYGGMHYIWSALSKSIMPAFNSNLMAGNPLFRESNILFPLDSLTGISFYKITGAGKQLDAQTGFYGSASGGILYKNAGVLQETFTGAGINTFYPSATYPTIIQSYRQGSIANQAFDIKVQADNSTAIQSGSSSPIYITASGLVVNQNSSGVPPNNATIVDLSATANKIIQLPNISNAGRDSLSSIAPNGGLFWNTGTNKFQYRTTAGSGAWHTLLDSAIVTGGTPTISVGAGAGTGATVSVDGTNGGGLITLITGASPSSSASILTLTYSTSFSNNSYPLTRAANAGTAVLETSNQATYLSGSASGFSVVGSTTALTASTTYKWYYNVTGK